MLNETTCCGLEILVSLIFVNIFWNNLWPRVRHRYVFFKKRCLWGKIMDIIEGWRMSEMICKKEKLLKDCFISFHMYNSKLELEEKQKKRRNLCLKLPCYPFSYFFPLIHLLCSAVSDWPSIIELWHSLSFLRMYIHTSYHTYRTECWNDVFWDYHFFESCSFFCLPKRVIRSLCLNSYNTVSS